MSKVKDAQENALHTMLRIEAPQGRVSLVDLMGDSYLVGRGDPTGVSRVDFQIPEDEFLSRVHAKIERDGEGGYLVENLSPNGTLVDGALIKRPTLLKGKTKIEIGQGTTLTFLVVTADERKRLFEEQSGVKERQAETGGGLEAPEKKSFLQRPVFLGLVVFYGLLAVVVLSMLGQKKATVLDPGKGPYFGDLMHGPVSTQRPEIDADAIADTMWKEALAKHGEPVVDEGGHAYMLVLAAQRVAGVLGYPTLQAALDKREGFAQKAKLVLDDLEKRVQADHELGQKFIDGRHWALAYDVYKRMAAAVPDNRSKVREFALDRVERLGPMR